MYYQRHICVMMQLVMKHDKWKTVVVCLWTHDDKIPWKCFLYFWPFVRGIHWSAVDSIHKGLIVQSFDVFFVVSLKKLLDKQTICQWFEMSCGTYLTWWRHLVPYKISEALWGRVLNGTSDMEMYLFNEYISFPCNNTHRSFLFSSGFKFHFIKSPLLWVIMACTLTQLLYLASFSNNLTHWGRVTAN